MRLDLFLSERGYAKSRTEAKGLIEEGLVLVCGRIVTKPAYSLSAEEEGDVILLRRQNPYVSRGGLKLEAALRQFPVSAKGELCIDVGASSGGFTDCLLQNGAEHVIALDSGSGQLALSLRADARVSVYEKYNARYLKEEDLPYRPTFAVMDVSFISATYLFAPLYAVLAPGADFICLVKPQFEVGRAGLGKGGIVRDEKLRREALAKVLRSAEEEGFLARGAMRSPIEGGDGNIEYLIHLKKPE